MQKLINIKDIFWSNFPLFFYLILAQALRRSHGALKSNHLLFITISIALLAYYHIKKPTKGKITNSLSHYLWIIFTFFLIEKTEIIYLQSGTYLNIYNYLLYISLALSIVSLKFFKERIYFIGMIIGSVCLLLVPLISPSPAIDVFTITTKASEYLLQGLNPYTQIYPDIYNGQYNYEPNLIYWPVGVLFNTISFKVLGDIRYINIFSIILSSIYLYKKRSPILALILLYFPVASFVIEQAWYEAIFFIFIILLFSMLKDRKTSKASILLGILCASKQFFIITAIHTFLFVFRSSKPREWLSYLFISIATGSILLGVFYVWNPDSFINNTIFNILKYPTRYDSLSWVAHFKVRHGIILNSLLLTSINIGAIILSALYLLKKKTVSISDLLVTQIITYTVIFIFAKQSFCNYYYLSSFLILIYVAFEDGKSSHSHQEISPALNE